MIRIGAFQDVSSQLTAQVRTDLKLKEFEQQLTSVFGKIKALLAAKIKIMISDPETRRKLLNKIDAITLSGVECGDGVDKDSVDGLLKFNAFYNPTDNKVRYCSGGALLNRSEFAIARIISHELGHSLDPCEISRGPKAYRIPYKAGTKEELTAQYPFADVITCLRGSSSVHATPMFDDDANVGASDAKNEVDVPFCHADQITESFADWMGAELLPEYIRKAHPDLTAQQLRAGYENSFRGMKCRAPDEPEYPTLPARINRLFLAQPEIRSQMGCKTELKGVAYCAHKAVSAPWESACVENCDSNAAR